MCMFICHFKNTIFMAYAEVRKYHSLKVTFVMDYTEHKTNNATTCYNF